MSNQLNEPALGLTNEQGQIEITGFGRPFGLKVLRDGKTYVTDMDLHTIFEITPDFTAYRVLADRNGWSRPQEFSPKPQKRANSLSPRQFNGPHSCAVSKNGKFCITTYYSPALHLLNQDAKLESVVDTLGIDTKLTGPATATYTTNGSLLITEYHQNVVFHWHPTSNLVTSILGPGDGPSSLNRPHMARQLPNGDIIIADTWNHRLVRTSTNGRLKSWWGVSADSGTCADRWQTNMNYGVATHHAHGLHAPVAIDIHASTGQLLVTDWGNNRLRLLDSEGQLISGVETLGLNKPYDACFWKNGYAIADSHNGRLLFIVSPESY